MNAETREYIRRLVDAAPPLTEDQKARLAVLLRPARDAVAKSIAARSPLLAKTVVLGMELRAKYNGPATLRVDGAGQWNLPQVRIQLHQEMPDGQPGLFDWKVSFEAPEDAQWALFQAASAEIELPDGRKGRITANGTGTGPAPIS